MIETLNYPNPWDFPEEIFSNCNTEKLTCIKYRMLNEIAMGAPLAGRCSFIDNENREILVDKWCGGNPIWNKEITKFAVPIWEKSFWGRTIQKIGIVDVKEKTLTKYKMKFSVIHLKNFTENIIKLIDSPIYKPKYHEFDILKETIQEVKKL